MPQTRRVCLREAAATAVREYKEFQKRSLFFICCILCLFSQQFATPDRQFHHHPGWQQARTPQGGVSVSSRHCLPTQISSHLVRCFQVFKCFHFAEKSIAQTVRRTRRYQWRPVDTSYSVDTCALVACCLRNAFPYTRGTYVTERYRSFIRFNM